MFTATFPGFPGWSQGVREFFCRFLKQYFTGEIDALSDPNQYCQQEALA